MDEVAVVTGTANNIGKAFQRGVLLLSKPTKLHRLPGIAVAMASLTLGACEKPAPAAAQQTPSPPAVTVLPLRPEIVRLMTELPGRTAAFRTAEVRPRVGGVVLERLFTEGAATVAGRPLYRIDPAPYQASLDSALAGLAKAEATTTSARSTVLRYRPLVVARAVSQQDLDTATAALREAEADIASARAGVATARLNLGYTQVTAPIAGRTGRSGVTAGALVTADQVAALLTITQLDPILVDITQPSATLLRLRREMEAGHLKRSGTASDQAEVRLTLEDGSAYAHPGALQFTEVIVDGSTGSVTLRAAFPNPDGLLMPGMFVRARLEEGTVNDALLVPQQAVSRTPRGEATAMVVGADGKAEPRKLRTERAVGNRWLVTEGLAPGDRVIVEGLQRVRPGSALTVTETTQQQLDAPVVPQRTAAR